MKMLAPEWKPWKPWMVVVVAQATRETINQYRFKILLCLLSLNGRLTAMSNNMLDLIKVVILTPV
jgi:hypothetical protein